MVNFRSPVTNRTERHGPVSGFAIQAADVAIDLVELAELQTRLAKADAKLAIGQAKMPIVMMIAGSCLALASLPVLTLGLATLLAATTALNVWQSQLTVGLLMGVFALVVIYWSVRAAGKSLLRFQRSAEQLANNVAWFKTTLKFSASTTSNSKGDDNGRDRFKA